MRVLLTGAAGFIGAHTVAHILKRTDWDIVGIVSYRHKGDSLRFHGTDAHDPERVQLIYHDLAGPLSPRLAEKIGPIDYVINMAADSHVDRSITDPVPFVENNVGVALHMLEYARTAKPRVFIQVSTDEVYGPAPAGYAHREWDAVIPSNPYSASKACQEAIATSYWRTYGVPVVITNTMNNFGEWQDAEKYVSLLIRSIARGDEVTIHGTPEQVGSRFYLHARNHADALLHLLNRAPAMYPASDRPDRWNVVGEREIDNLTLARMVAKIVGKPLRYTLVDFHSARPGHDLRYALDGTKLADEGWVPPIGLEESLERTVRWTLAHPEWLA